MDIRLLRVIAQNVKKNKYSIDIQKDGVMIWEK